MLLDSGVPLIAFGRRTVVAPRVSGSAPLVLPVTPTGLAVTSGAIGSSGFATWSASAGATSYSLERSPSGAGTWTTIAAGQAGLSKYDGRMIVGAFDYRVWASNSAGDSAHSAIVTATYTLPTLTTVGLSYAGAYEADNLSLADGDPVSIFTDLSAFAKNLSAVSGTRPTYYKKRWPGSGGRTSISLVKGSAADTLFLLDTFRGTDDTEITSRGGEIGTWAYHIYGPSGGAIIHSNRACRGTGTFVLKSSSGAVSADYVITGQFYIVSNAGATGIYGRVGNDETWYELDLTWNGSTQELNLYKAVSGNYTLLATYAPNLSVGSTYEIKLSMVGTAIKAYINGVQRISVTDSAISSAGAAGFSIGTGNTTTAGYHLDSIQAEYVPSGTGSKLQALLANDWKFLHDGTPWAIGLTFRSPTWARWRYDDQLYRRRCWGDVGNCWVWDKTCGRRELFLFY